MSYTVPTSRTTGELVTAAIWNVDIVDNIIELRAGGISVSGQAARDVVFASSATQLKRLAAGTSGDYLQTKGSGSDPVWTNPFAFASQAARDIFFASSATAWTRLAAGASGQFLQTLGTGTDPAWADVTSTDVLEVQVFS